MGKHKEAKAIFDKAILMNPKDTELKTEAGELFLDAGRYELALHFLTMALEECERSLHLINRIAMALRKLGRFEDAEGYYRNALSFAKEDPNLYFNMGRLYLDWRQWKKAVKAASLALRLDPAFDHARKLQEFAEKKLGQASGPVS